MKGKALFTRWPVLGLALALVILLVGLPGAVGAQRPESESAIGTQQSILGTAFTYQGRLFDGGNPAEGTFDLQFKLYDAESGGHQLGSTVTKPITVTDGIFVVELDFGSGSFNGDTRWLEIYVNGTKLEPRQRIRPSPYALALPGLRTQPNDTSPNVIGGFRGNTVRDGVVGATISGGGGPIPSGYGVNEVTDRYGTISGGNENLAGNETGSTSDAPYATVGGGYRNQAIGPQSTIGGGSDNETQGSCATVPGGRGNTAAGDYSFAAGRYATAAHAGSFVWADSTDANFASTGPNQFLVRATGGASFTTNGAGLHVDGLEVLVDDPGYSIRADGTGRSYFAGDVGIGTTSPGAKLDVAGNVIVGGLGTNNVLFFNDDGTGNPDLARISTETADTALDIVGPGGCPGGDCSNRQVNIHNRLAVYGDLATTGQVTGRGVVGEATATSGAAYGVVGESKSPDGAGVVARGIDYGADLILAGNADTMTGDDGRIYSDPAYSSSDIWLITNDGVGIKLDHNRDGEESDFDIYDNDDNLIFRVNNSGTTSIRGNIILQSSSTGATIMELGEGLDYAEGFDVSDKTEVVPGTVLIIDPEHPGELTISDQPYDSKVAGIVAGAKGMGSAVRLGAGQFDYDVALAGRVYCNVDATEAGVEPGDLLTTSATPGYAMKATDYARAQGAILGKAMEGLEKGEKGQILVLVTLQ